MNHNVRKSVGLSNSSDPFFCLAFFKFSLCLKAKRGIKRVPFTSAGYVGEVSETLKVHHSTTRMFSRSSKKEEGIKR